MHKRRETAETRFRENLVEGLWRYGQAHGLLRPVRPTNSELDRRFEEFDYFLVVDELLWLVDCVPTPTEDRPDEDLKGSVSELLGKCQTEQVGGLPPEDLLELIRDAFEQAKG